MSEVRSIHALTRDEVVRIARDLADSGEAMAHGYEEGSVQAVTFEHAFLERRCELDALQAETV